MRPWSLRDQLNLTGRHGKFALVRALAKQRRLRARATRNAQRSTARHLAFLNGELTAEQYYTDGGPSPEMREVFLRIVQDGQR